MRIDIGEGFVITDEDLRPGYYGVAVLVDPEDQPWLAGELCREDLDAVGGIVMCAVMCPKDSVVERKLVDTFNAWAKGYAEISLDLECDSVSYCPVEVG